MTTTDRAPRAFLAGWFRVHDEAAPALDPESDPRILVALDRRQDDGKQCRVRRYRFCPHGAVYRVLEP